jgi:uncharacterized damage-inducible protein DinB
MPNKSKKSSAASAKKKPAQKTEPTLADVSPQRLHILQRLEESMSFLDSTLAKISDDAWTVKPSPSQWSIGEIMHHLILVEVQRLELIKAMLAGKKESLPPRDTPAPDIAAARASPNKNQAPPEMQPKAGLPIKVLRAALRRARAETKAFVESVDLQKAGGLWLRTASLGVVNAAEYLEFLSAHMERHTDQIVRVAAQI